MIRIVLFACLIAACSRSPGQAAQSVRSEEGRERMLATQDPGAHEKIDEKIRKLQQHLESVDSWLQLGEAWVQKSRETQRPALYANAGACASRALAIDPQNRIALDLQGLVLMNDHRFAEAAQLMKRLTALSPNDPAAWGTLSDAQLELGDMQSAIASAQRMIDLKPNLPSYSRAAHLEWLRADLAGAKESLRSAIDAGNGSLDREPRAWVLCQAAMIFWNEGDYEGALAGFDQALREQPNFAPALQGRGRVLIGRGEGKAAADALARSYKINPLIETGWLLGDALAEAGDAEQSQKIYAEIEKRGAVDPRTLALFLATKDLQHDEALKLALDERKTRDDQYTEDAVAWAEYRAGNLGEARKASAVAVALGTRDARLWFHRGAILLASGDHEQGREWISRALKLNPHFDRSGALEAKLLLAEAKN